MEIYEHDIKANGKCYDLYINGSWYSSGTYRECVEEYEALKRKGKD